MPDRGQAEARSFPTSFVVKNGSKDALNKLQGAIPSPLSRTVIFCQARGFLLWWRPPATEASAESPAASMLMDGDQFAS